MKVFAILLTVCLLAISAKAQPNSTIFPYPGEGEYRLPPRLALVVGIDHYENVPRLQAAVSDARLMAQRLESIGFIVTQLVGEVPRIDNEGNAARVDLVTRDRLIEAIERFARDVADARTAANGSAPVVVFYFAGHGFHANGLNHLIPHGARFSSTTVAVETSIPLYLVTRMLHEAGPRVLFLITDACRNYLDIQTGLSRAEREPPLLPWFQNPERAELRSAVIPQHLRIEDQAAQDHIFYIYATMQAETAGELRANQAERASRPAAEGGRFTLALASAIERARQRSMRSESLLIHQVWVMVEREMHRPGARAEHMQRAVFDHRQAYEMRPFPTQRDFANEQALFQESDPSQLRGAYEEDRRTLLCNLFESQFRLRYGYFGDALARRVHEEGLANQRELNCDQQTESATAPGAAGAEAPAPDPRAQPAPDLPARVRARASLPPEVREPQQALSDLLPRLEARLAHIRAPSGPEGPALASGRRAAPPPLAMPMSPAPTLPAAPQETPQMLERLARFARASQQTPTRIEIPVRFDEDATVLTDSQRQDLGNRLSILGGMVVRSAAVLHPRHAGSSSALRGRHVWNIVRATMSALQPSAEIVPLLRRVPESLPDLDEEEVRIVLDVAPVTDAARDFQSELLARGRSLRFVRAPSGEGFVACPVGADGRPDCDRSMALFTPPDRLDPSAVAQGPELWYRSLTIAPRPRDIVRALEGR